MDTNKYTKMIIDFICDTTYENLPAEVVENAKGRILDSCGVTIKGGTESVGTVIKEFAKEYGGKGAVEQATLWGSNKKIETDDAVLYNGALIHGLDYDDTNGYGIVHPSSSVVTAALTVGEALGKSGKDIITAAVVGYEVLLRVAGFTHGRLHDRGFHPTGCCNAFSSACIAGKLMGVTPEELKNALGMAGSQAAAILQFLRDGTDIKKLHPGWGVHAALYDLAFAKEGYSGPLEVLEGEQGFFLAHVGSVEGVEDFFDDFGKRWWTKEIAFKFYPVCHWLHGFNDILFKLEAENSFGADDIEELETIIDERVWRVGYATDDKKRPATEYHQRFSLFYTMGMAAYKGRLGPREINIEHMKDPALLKMIDRVKVTVDPKADVPGHFPAQLRVKLKDGRSFYESQPYEVGSPENPATREQVLNKYYANMDGFIARDAAEKLVDGVDHIEQLTNASSLISAMVVK